VSSYSYLDTAYIIWLKLGYGHAERAQSMIKEYKIKLEAEIAIGNVDLNLSKLKKYFLR
jgi:hypothetical protein